MSWSLASFTSAKCFSKWVDDFMHFCDSLTASAEFEEVKKFLDSWGVEHHKHQGPQKRIVCCGIQWRMDDGTAHLSDKSKLKYITLLADAERRQYWFLPYLLSLLGVLEFVCALVPVAVPFVKPLRALRIVSAGKRKNQRIHFSDLVRRSLAWFRRSLQNWNGAFTCFRSPSIAEVRATFRMDFSPSFGAGFWSPDTLSFGMLKFEKRETDFCLANSLTPSSTRGELLTVMATLQTVGNSIRGGAAIFIVDALNVERGMLKLRSSCPEIDILLQTLASMIIHFECFLIFQVVPREQNREADALSKGFVNSWRKLVQKDSKLGTSFNRISATTMFWPAARFWPKARPFYSQSR